MFPRTANGTQRTGSFRGLERDGVEALRVLRT
jgi:hypothetical protein